MKIIHSIFFSFLLLFASVASGTDAPADRLAAYLAPKAVPLKQSGDLDRLIKKAGDKKLVLLGESTHGTHEFYKWRSEISKRLIAEKDFSFIAVEGDWPSLQRHDGCRRTEDFRTLASLDVGQPRHRRIGRMVARIQSKPTGKR